jgi:hypothetical protein
VVEQRGQRGLEEVVSKRCDAPHRSGEFRDWRKVKTVTSREAKHDNLFTENGRRLAGERAPAIRVQLVHEPDQGRETDEGATIAAVERAIAWRFQAATVAGVTGDLPRIGDVKQRLVVLRTAHAPYELGDLNAAA